MRYHGLIVPLDNETKRTLQFGESMTDVSLGSEILLAGPVVKHDNSMPCRVVLRQKRTCVSHPKHGELVVHMQIWENPTESHFNDGNYFKVTQRGLADACFNKRNMLLLAEMNPMCYQHPDVIAILVELNQIALDQPYWGCIQLK